jgi:hypothetical protein
MLPSPPSSGQSLLFTFISASTSSTHPYVSPLSGFFTSSICPRRGGRLRPFCVWPFNPLLKSTGKKHLYKYIFWIKKSITKPWNFLLQLDIPINYEVINAGYNFIQIYLNEDLKPNYRSVSIGTISFICFHLDLVLSASSFIKEIKLLFLFRFWGIDCIGY